MKLIIKEAGFEVNIQGIPIFRTPAKIDITNLDLTKLVTSLKTSGITCFEIINDDKIREFKVFSKNKLNSKKDNINISSKDNEIINFINERFNQLENLISNIKNIKTYKYSENEKEFKEKFNIDENDNFFIPKINIDNMKLNKSNNITIKSENNNEDDVNSLSKILKKKD